MLQNLKELFSFREMLKNLVIKELRVRYKESALGFLWTLFTPLLNMAVYTLVFSVMLQMGMKNYPVFLLSGIFPWVFFQTSLGSGCVSIVHNASLVKKVYFPTEILPLSIVFSNFINFLLSMVVFFVLVLVFRVEMHMTALVLPLIFIVQIALTTGLTLIVAVATVYFRDIEHFLGVFLFALFYATPVIYTGDRVPQGFQFFFGLNPMTTIIQSYQNILYFGKLPDWGPFLIVSAVSLGCLILGYYLYSKYKGMLPEEV